MPPRSFPATYPRSCAVLLALALLTGALIARPVQAQGLAQARLPEPDMASARRLVYGGPTWRDARAERFLGRDALAHVTEVFRAGVRVQGQAQLWLAYQLTPGPHEQFRCHACVPGLGVALLGQEGDRWRLLARGELLAPGAPYSGDEDLQLIELADEQWALRSRRYDVALGLESRRERLILRHQDRLVLALDQGFTDKPGPGACGGQAGEQTTGLSVLSPGQGPRIELVLRYNEGSCPSPTPQVRRLRFELRDGLFQPEPDAVPAGAQPSL
jgi:hypothetical protein